MSPVLLVVVAALGLGQRALVAGAVGRGGPPVDRARALGIGLLVVAAAGFVLTAPGLGLVGLGLGLAGRRGVERWRAGRARRAADDALPDAVDAVARSLRSGWPLAVALDHAAAGAPPLVAAELAPLGRALERGAPVAGVLDRWAAGSRLDGASLVVAALDLVGAAGGDVAAALDGVGDTLRDRRAARRETVALGTQARASASLLAVAPIAFGAVAATIDPRSARFLLTSAPGLACLTVGLLLDLAAWRWMRRITEAPNHVPAPSPAGARRSLVPGGGRAGAPATDGMARQ